MEGGHHTGIVLRKLKRRAAVSAATAAFSANVTDPKASIITTYNFIAGSPGISLLLFYDYPTPPKGIFDAFLDIPHFTKDVDTRTFLSLVKSSPVQVTDGLRSHFQMVPVLEYTPAFLEAVVNQSTYWGQKLSWASGSFFSYAVEPFLPNIYQHNAGLDTAYPPARNRFYSPFNVFFGWLAPSQDTTFQNSVLESARALVAAASAEGQSNLDSIPLYPNYASSRMTLQQVYGTNVPRLRALKQRVDPDDVMGLAGGFKF
ncbi:hypothetical protein NMY22_g17869 [Coprinellus aureogranulatus]|nr:hypothetical protein NMY22_g17869 [Coprinellus aureogranulatus]